MIYKKFQDKALSALGLGCMRLPTNEDGSVDVEATREMVDTAMREGINYYDTAWGYHGGRSEPVMGEILENYPRDSFYLASKFPGYDLSNMDKVEEIFEAQLKRCRVDYFDFYLVHNVCELNIDQYLDPQYRIREYLLEQKKNGRIRHLGFSAHGTIPTMKRFLDVYGPDMEFCQIQLNWLDWDLQDAKTKVELLRERHLPIWVMEPVRGGKLAQLEPTYAQRLATLRPDWTPARWAFRFLQSIDDVVVTLSGMSNLAQLQENCETYRAAATLTEEETATLLSVAREMTAQKTLPCTSCRYCTSYCPMGLDIPYLIGLYNEHTYSGGGFLAPMAVGALAEDKRPTACLGCRACEAVCPQNIRISEMMTDFAGKLQ
ncbi:MAG: aldo/keto reductase [Clostridia bacterium]|nr:aldo/keto reductase [Clostridia bacterium]